MNPLTEKDYLANIEKAKTLLVDLKENMMTPAEIGQEIKLCSSNLNQLSKMLSDAMINLQINDQVLKAIKLEHDIKRDSAMLLDEVAIMKSAELRAAKTTEMIKEVKINLLTAQQNRDSALTYVEVIQRIYETLATNVSLLKEHVKLLQGLTYLETNTTKKGE